jgi:hypothetical protein
MIEGARRYGKMLFTLGVVKEIELGRPRRANAGLI